MSTYLEETHKEAYDAYVESLCDGTNLCRVCGEPIGAGGSLCGDCASDFAGQGEFCPLCGERLDPGRGCQMCGWGEEREEPQRVQQRPLLVPRYNDLVDMRHVLGLHACRRAQGGVYPPSGGRSKSWPEHHVDHCRVNPRPELSDGVRTVKAATDWSGNNAVAALFRAAASTIFITGLVILARVLG